MFNDHASDCRRRCRWCCRIVRSSNISNIGCSNVCSCFMIRPHTAHMYSSERVCVCILLCRIRKYKYTDFNVSAIRVTLDLRHAYRLLYNHANRNGFKSNGKILETPTMAIDYETTQTLHNACSFGDKENISVMLGTPMCSDVLTEIENIEQFKSWQNF